MEESTHLIVMGVSGCGKSTVARILSEHLGWPMLEGDDLHPASNVKKMSAGIPLTDEDRWPWLGKITAWTAEQGEQGRSTVVTCSALRRSYRDRLRQVPGKTVFVYLSGSRELLAERLGHRTGHFMPATLLDSQLATLEPLADDEPQIVVDIADGSQAAVEAVLARLR